VKADFEPRCLSRKEAAAYCGCASLAAFDDWVRRGLLPKPIRTTKRWDRKAIDLALDKASGLVTKCEQPQSSKGDAEAALQQWLSERAH
jgi:predicted DNA-binding transcriptional regulator AlpA